MTMASSMGSGLPMDDLATRIAGAAAAVSDRVAALPDRPGQRRLVAIAGPPGAGKSTLAGAVVQDLTGRGHAAALMPMDGFHLDDRLLQPRGLLERKGAPETFDFGGFAATLGRVRREPLVVIPVFDRNREIAIAGAAEVGPDTRIVVVEGNYLLLDEEPWSALAPLWDHAVFLSVPLAELERRLVARWLSFGFDPAAARQKARGNDLANAGRVMGAIGQADQTLDA